MANILKREEDGVLIEFMSEELETILYAIEITTNELEGELQTRTAFYDNEYSGLVLKISELRAFCEHYENKSEPRAGYEQYCLVKVKLNRDELLMIRAALGEPLSGFYHEFKGCVPIDKVSFDMLFRSIDEIGRESGYY